MQKALDRNVLTENTIFKFARKAQEYKSTYFLLLKMTSKSEAKQIKVYMNDIKHITKVFKAH